jgi:hypothetical protein
VLVQNIDARLYTRVTDIYGRPGDKPPDLIGISAAERATQALPA